MNELSLLAMAGPTGLPGQTASIRVLKICDDTALQNWATPIPVLGVSPGHLTAAEYYAVAAESLKTYLIDRPDKEPRAC